VIFLETAGQKDVSGETRTFSQTWPATEHRIQLNERHFSLLCANEVVTKFSAYNNSA